MERWSWRFPKVNETEDEASVEDTVRMLPVVERYGPAKRMVEVARWLKAKSQLELEAFTRVHARFQFEEELLTMEYAVLQFVFDALVMLNAES
jgi:hypothetical protein